MHGEVDDILQPSALTTSVDLNDPEKVKPRHLPLTPSSPTPTRPRNTGARVLPMHPLPTLALPWPARPVGSGQHAIAVSIALVALVFRAD